MLDLAAIKERSKRGRVRGFGPLWSDVDSLVEEVERLRATEIKLREDIHKILTTWEEEKEARTQQPASGHDPIGPALSAEDEYYGKGPG